MGAYKTGENSIEQMLARKSEPKALNFTMLQFSGTDLGSRADDDTNPHTSFETSAPQPKPGKSRPKRKPFGQSGETFGEWQCEAFEEQIDFCTFVTDAPVSNASPIGIESCDRSFSEMGPQVMREQKQQAADTRQPFKQQLQVTRTLCCHQ